MDSGRSHLPSPQTGKLAVAGLGVGLCSGRLDEVEDGADADSMVAVAVGMRTVEESDTISDKLEW